MLIPGAEVLKRFLSTSFGLCRVATDVFDIELREAVDDDPLRDVAEVVVVGDTPRDPSTGKAAAAWLNVPVSRRRGLLCGLSFGLASFSAIVTVDDREL